uniref:Uncharacterized protein TCIL3000_9_2840 n=1 Tax=Trypanosoma congolense (strain IL3000) TaxID=1068625 RepID=G0UU23_TRYCI|nr:unnamed protein product [Trypanosoma congolense IL3000]
MFQRKCSGSLYTLMGLDESATEKEIKKSYRRLALSLHPDKTGGTTTEQFTRVQEAYDILSDKQQRRAYDTFGKEGIDALNTLNNMNIPPNVYGFRAVCFILMVCSLILLLQLELIIIRQDYQMSWSWPLLLIPLWATLTPFFIFGLVLLAAGTRRLEFSNIYVGLELLTLVGAVVACAFAVWGAIKWSIALLPAMALYALCCGHVIPQMSPSRFLQYAEGDNEPSFHCGKFFVFILRTLFEKACGGTFFAFAMFRATQDNSPGTGGLLSFWLVSSPLIVYLTLQTLVDLCLCIFGGNTQEASESIPQANTSGLSFIFDSGLLYMVCMTALKANVVINGWTGGFNPSLAVIVIPLQLFLVFLVFFTSFLFCTASWIFDASLLGAENEQDNEAASLFGGAASWHADYQQVPGDGSSEEKKKLSEFV